MCSQERLLCSGEALWLRAPGSGRPAGVGQAGVPLLSDGDSPKPLSYQGDIRDSQSPVLMM